MIGILHGYFLEGSGSNLWTRHVCEALCRAGQDVILFCQENHPENYPFIQSAYRYHLDDTVEGFHQATSPYPGRVFLHKPQLGDTLPVYVGDKYEEFSNPVPMPKLSSQQLDFYLDRNIAVVKKVVTDRKIGVLIANHTVLMPTVAQRVHEALGTDYVVVPHGSAIEYAVKKDERLKDLATEALTKARAIFCVSTEMKSRVQTLFPSVPQLPEKIKSLGVGVDTSAFRVIQNEQRPREAMELFKKIRTLPKGKSPEQEKILSEIHDSANREQYIDTLKESGSYTTKNTDTACEEKLTSIDWENSPKLLFVGRLIAAKGPQCLLVALPFILEKLPDLRLIIVGHGPLREPMEAFLHALRKGNQSLAQNILEWQSPLEKTPTDKYFLQITEYFKSLGEEKLSQYFQLAKKTIKSDSVIFTGFLSHDELVHLYPCCDAAVFPSLVLEAGPMVFLEAMACGCFPIGVDQGGMENKLDTLQKHLPEKIAKSLRLDPERVIFDLTENVPKALESPSDLRKSLRDVAEAYYDWTTIAKGLLKDLRPSA